MKIALSEKLEAELVRRGDQMGLSGTDMARMILAQYLFGSDRAQMVPNGPVGTQKGQPEEGGTFKEGEEAPFRGEGVGGEGEAVAVPASFPPTQKLLETSNEESTGARALQPSGQDPIVVARQALAILSRIPRELVYQAAEDLNRNAESPSASGEPCRWGAAPGRVADAEERPTEPAVPARRVEAPGRTVPKERTPPLSQRAAGSPVEPGASGPAGEPAATVTGSNPVPSREFPEGADQPAAGGSPAPEPTRRATPAGDAVRSGVTAGETAPSGKKQRGSRPTIGPRFEAFWSAWPPGPRKHRQPAEKAWAKASLPSERADGSDPIVEAVEWLKKRDDWQRDDGAFIPAPAVWLNQQRWEAVLDAMARRPTNGTPVPGQPEPQLKVRSQNDLHCAWIDTDQLLGRKWRDLPATVRDDLQARLDGLHSRSSPKGEFAPYDQIIALREEIERAETI